jgi:hypothetical protein
MYDIHADMEKYLDSIIWLGNEYLREVKSLLMFPTTRLRFKISRTMSTMNGLRSDMCQRLIDYNLKCISLSQYSKDIKSKCKQFDNIHLSTITVCTIIESNLWNII